MVNETKEFTEWIGKNHYHLEDIYSIYTRDRSDGEYYPDYDTFVCSKWTTVDEIPSIMADNDNTELEWVLENSYTLEELYDKWLKS